MKETDINKWTTLITENLQRKDVDPIEEAFAFGQLIKKGASAEEVAVRFGKSVRFVQDRVKLNNLIPELLLLVKEGRMPIVSAMIVSKLDEEVQRKFYEHNGRYDNTSKSCVERFLSDCFMRIDHAPWYDTDNEEDEHFDGGCNCKCAECQFNTANAGCLFWEMKADGEGRCTNRAKFREKQLAWMYDFIQKHGGEMVGKGDELEYGKTVIIDTFYGYSDNHKEFHAKVMQDLADNGYEVVKSDFFGPKCSYTEDDERAKELHKNGEVYRCIDIWGCYSSIEPDVVFYYLKSSNEDCDASTKGSIAAAEVVRLTGQYKRNHEIAEENLVAEYRKLANDIGEAKRRGPINEYEQFALDCFMLAECGDGMRQRYGLDKYGPSAQSIMDAVRNNQADRQMWYREFLRVKFGSTAMYRGSLACKLSHNVLSDWKPTAIAEIGEKSVQTLEKKQQRIKEKLEALGYDVNGKKLEA